MHEPRYIPAPCANCGKPEGGFMGSTEWGHDYYCCSDECGRSFKTSPKRAEADLRRAEVELSYAKQKVANLEAAIKEQRSAAPTQGGKRMEAGNG